MIDTAARDSADLDPEDLLKEAQHGSQRAFDLLCDRYSDLVFRTAYLLLGDAGGAEDVAQEVLLMVYRNGATYQPEPSIPGPVRFKTWLCTITRNTCMNALRGRRRRWLRSMFSFEHLSANGSEPPARHPLPLEQVLRSEEQREIWQAVRRLSPKLREVIVFRYYHEMSYAEVAAVLACPVGTVRSRLNAAHANLRVELGVHYGFRPDQQ